MTKTLNYSAALATIAALVLSMTAAAPAFASGGGELDVEVDNDVTIEVANFGAVINNTSAEASTGGNYAGGSEGGEGANGGSGGSGEEADADADADGDDADADAEANGGNGGNGGAGGEGGAGGVGGTVSTGDAEANAGTMNVVNSNDIKVEGCGCDAVDLDDAEDFDDADVDVDNEVEIGLFNGGFVLNNTDAYAKTGWNAAGGSDGGNAGEGGNGGEGDEADADADADGEDSDADAEANGGEGGEGGEGGNGGAGDEGGLVVTGDARSNAGTINLVNTNVIRVIR